MFRQKTEAVEDAALKPKSWHEADIRALIDEGDCTVDSRIYTDQELYDLEMERVFGRSWLFLAHESYVDDPHLQEP